MSDISDYIGIRGWCATVSTIFPTHNSSAEPEQEFVIRGNMCLLPNESDREFTHDGTKLSLDVLFHCYTTTIAERFFKAVKENDMLIVSGDLSPRGWVNNPNEPNTNFWLDEFVVDPSRHKVAPLSGNATVSDMREYIDVANNRFDDSCNFCKEKTLQVSGDNRKYCPNCDD